MHLTDQDLVFLIQLMDKLQFKIGSGQDFITASNLHGRVAEEIKSRQKSKEISKDVKVVKKKK